MNKYCYSKKLNEKDNNLENENKNKDNIQVNYDKNKLIIES